MVGRAEAVAAAVEVSHNELKALVKLYFKAKRALFCWGATGIGKSQTVKQAGMEIAEELKLEYTEDISRINDEKAFVVVDIRLAQCDPSDLRGIPIYDKEKMATVWLPPEMFPRKGYGIIFFDELNLSPPLVQASAYQMILDRRLGTYVVPDGFLLIAAGNRLEDRASVFEMSAPLKNRFGHCQLREPSVEAWTRWAVDHDIDMRLIGFLNFRRTALYTFDAKLKENAFATPRSWEHLSNLIKDAESDNIALIQQIASTQVGVGTAGELATFIRVKDKLHPMKYYLDNPDDCELPDENTQPDLIWALITSFAEYYKAHTDTPTLTKIIGVLRRMNEEYAVFTLKLMVTVDRQLTQKIIKIPQASKLARKLIDFFE
ncbi:hypothetical protein COS75_01020 [Candidatus Pacearchaeota archaeon CG06_land_8_20_14_3_00_35_12]|nr:MAG: hypothetical protein COS75_01020 [Candidatus Pacearchaeota archaeon CG06_land_8_20_14_3_00_35_12]